MDDIIQKDHSNSIIQLNNSTLVTQNKESKENKNEDFNLIENINECDNINLIQNNNEYNEKIEQNNINILNKEKDNINVIDKNNISSEEKKYTDDEDDNFNLLDQNENEVKDDPNINKIINEEKVNEKNKIDDKINQDQNNQNKEKILEINNNEQDKNENETEIKEEKESININENKEKIENIENINEDENINNNEANSLKQNLIDNNTKENIKQKNEKEEKNIEEKKKENNIENEINENAKDDNKEGIKEKYDINLIPEKIIKNEENKENVKINEIKENLNDKEIKDNKNSKDNENKIEEINEISKKYEKIFNNKNVVKNEDKKMENNLIQNLNQKDLEKIADYHKSNYLIFYSEKHFCDYNSGKEWRAGFIINIEDGYAKIIDATNKNSNDDIFKKVEIKITDSQNIAYFRKFSKPDNYMAKGSSKNLKNKLEEFTKFHKNFKIYIKNCDDYQFYYFLRVSVYYGLDFCMNININTNNNNDNIQISFRLILIILDIIVDCLKFIEENLDDFIQYQYNIKGTDLNDLVLINKKYAIFSFFDDIHFLIKKIFGDSVQYLDWYIKFQNEINKFNPAAIENLEESLIPIYNNKIEEQNKSFQKICFPSIYYNSKHIFHTLDKEISSCIISYFTDYFSFIGGFQLIFRLIYSIKISKEQNNGIIFNIQKTLLNDLYTCRAITDTYYNSHEEEKKKLQNYAINYLDNFDDKNFEKINKNEMNTFFNQIFELTEKDKERKDILKENIHINFIFKEVQFAKKLEKQISFLSELNNIIKKIENNNSNMIDNNAISQKRGELLKNKNLNEDKMEIKKMTAEYFCQICHEKNVINIFFGDNTIHEEIIKRILPLLKIMHSNNYGYLENEKDKINAIKFNLITIIIKKLKESEKNNESLFKIIQEIILDFIQILSPDDKNFVFLELIKYFVESINNKSSKIIPIITLLINYSIKCIKNTNQNNILEKYSNEIDYASIMKIHFNENEFYFLETLINFLLEKNKIKQLNFTKEQNINIINLCVEGVINILKEFNFNNIILKIIFTKIITAISSAINTIPNIELLEQVINLNKKNNKFKEEIKNLCEKTNVLKSIFEKFYKYLSEIISLNSRTETDKEIINSNQEEELYDYKTNLEKRLNFVFLLLNKENNIEISFEDFQNLFTILSLNDIFTKQIFYSTIKSNILNLNYEFRNNIFEKIILNEKVFQINDVMSYQLMKEFVLEMNKSSNNFKFINEKELLVTTNYGKDIYGYNYLWDILTKIENKEIQNDLTNFLRDIILGVRFEKMNSYKEFWNQTIDRIIEILKKSSEKNKENNNAIKGIVILIKKIIDESINEGEIIQDRILIKTMFEKLEITIQQNDIQDDLNENINNKNFKAVLEYHQENSVEKETRVISNNVFFYHFKYWISYIYQIPLKCIEIEIPFDDGRKKMNLFSDYFNLYVSYLNYQENQTSKLEKDPFTIIIKRIKNPLDDDRNKNNIKALINSNLELFNILMRLLKNKNVKYTKDIWEIIKDKNDINKNKEEIFNKFNILINNKDNNDELLKEMFNLEETSMIYQNYILSNLYNFLSDDKVDKKEGIIKFVESNLWKNKIKNIQNEYKIIKNNEKKINITINELLEEKKFIYNILNIYKIIIDNTSNNEEIVSFIINQIINIIFDLIKDSIDIDLNSLSDENVDNKTNNIYEIKQLYLNILNTINNLFENNENAILNFFQIFKSENEMVIDEKEFIGKIKFIFIEGIIRNKFPFLSEKISIFVNSLIKNKCFGKNNEITNLQKQVYIYISSIFFSSETNERIINIFNSLFNNNEKDKDKDDIINIYEYNIKLYYKTTGEILNNIYKLTYDKYDYEKYIINYVIPFIYDPLIKDIKKESIAHDLYFGGQCQILLNYIQAMSINDNISKEQYSLIFNYKEKSLKDYLFNEVIMYKCDKDIIIPNKRIKINKSQIQATHLFISIVIKEINEENNDLFFGNDLEHYLERLDHFNKLGYWRGDQISDWNLNYQEENNNAITSFIGLKNFGCTCYMNSLLQVFYHLIPFRESILNCPCKEEKKNCLYETRKLFNSLKFLRDNYYYTPESFVDNFDNEKINRHQQMDVDEFFTNILDKLENRLKNTENENVIKYFFQGTLNDKLSFQEGCTHHRTNVNSFYSIQLQVQNKKNIYESLDAFTEGELMNGDNCIYCETCNKKFPAIKSQCFNELPRILMFVLKRFEFNYDTMRKIKINDFYEFPLELDMNKYTNEYIDNKNDKINNKYTLKSVVVHQGHSEGGHYYVFIKDNLSQTWYNFNDTKVNKFDINDLANETFGGKEDNMERNKNKSAYLLFYEKIDESNCKSFDKIKAINILNNKNKENEDNELNLIDNEDKKENNDNNEINMDEDMQEMLKKANQESVLNFLNKKLFSNEYHLLNLELFINILNYIDYGNNNLLSSFEDLYISKKDYVFQSELNNLFRKNRPKGSNINKYVNKGNIQLFYYNIKDKNFTEEEKEGKIINLFKFILIDFFNVVIRSKDKKYFACYVDLIKFLINKYEYCANYLLEEFSCYNVILEYLINCPKYEIKKIIVGIIFCAMNKSYNEYINNPEKMKEKQEKIILNSKLKDNLKLKNDISNNILTDPKYAEIYKNEEIINNLILDKNEPKVSDLPTEDMGFETFTKEEIDDVKATKSKIKNTAFSYFKMLTNTVHNFTKDKTKKEKEKDKDKGKEQIVVKSENDFEIIESKKENIENIVGISKIKNEDNNCKYLKSKYMSPEVLKFVYNIIYVIKKIKYQYRKELRFLYDVLLKFCLVSDRAKEFLIEIINLKLKLNSFLFRDLLIENINYDDFDKIDNIEIDKGYFNPCHEILNSSPNNPIMGESDKTGNFYNLNYDYDLLLLLLFFKEKPKEELEKKKLNLIFSFYNKKYIYNLITCAITKQDINYLSRLLVKKCFDNKIVFNNIVETLIYILNNIIDCKNSFYDKIEEEKNDDIYNNSTNVKLKAKRNRANILIIFKKIVNGLKDNNTEYRFKHSIQELMTLFKENKKYYGATITIINIIIDIYSNVRELNDKNQKVLQDILEWLNKYPIPPKLYEIKGITMYKPEENSSNSFYSFQREIDKNEKKEFDKKEIQKTKKKIEIINKILHGESIEKDISDYNCDLSDFQFAIGDQVIYEGKDYIITNYIDEYIKIKLLKNIEDNQKEKDFKVKGYKEKQFNISEKEKISFWVETDKYNLRIKKLV